METAATIATKAAVAGIPYLWEWGGMVTLLVLFVITLIVACGFSCWVIYQMYQQNQKVLQASLEAQNNQADANRAQAEATRHLTDLIKATRGLAS